jgi:aspartate-semialdehyde dehydrogenase
VAVIEGHTEWSTWSWPARSTEADIVGAWRGFGAELCGSGLPSAPAALIHVHRPVPPGRLDRDCGDGMTTVVGRLRRDEHSPTGWKYLLVSHNTKMGAAKGCILLAEQLIERKEIGR